MSRSTELRFRSPGDAGQVGALWLRPPDAEWLLVLGHGAGAPMGHPFLESMAGRLAARRIATFRYNFPYMERGGKRPDPPRVLEATVRSAAACAAEMAEGLPLLAGGKSMGGRITSQAQAAAELPGTRGVVFFGFPLHAPGRPGAARGDHLSGVGVPLLFLQGTRDRLCDLKLMAPVVGRLGAATLCVIDGADHSFHVPKRSGRTNEDVLDELADAVRSWASGIPRG